MGLKETVAAKQAWRALQKRAGALPKRYAIVYREIQKYLLTVDPIALTTQQQPLNDLLDLFEAGADRGVDVLAVTGPDVAAFADGLIASDHPFIDEWLAQTDEQVKQALDGWSK